MKVSEVMSKDVRSCNPSTNLASAAMIMWERDCGALPVVDEEDKVVAMITDRDIAMAVTIKGRYASDITVSEVMSENLTSVTENQTIKTALKIMSKEKVRRLPVLDKEGRLTGIISINDIALKAGEARGKAAPAISSDDALGAFKSICEHRF